MSEERIAALHQLLEQEPNDTMLLFGLANDYHTLGQFAEAITYFERALAVDPEYAWAHECVLVAARKSGRDEEVRASLEELSRILHAPPSAIWPRWYLEKLEAAASSELYVSPFGIALLKLELGDRAGALDALERAYEERDGFLVHLAVDPRLEPLHEEPRFRALVGNLGLEAD